MPRLMTPEHPELMTPEHEPTVLPTFFFFDDEQAVSIEYICGSARSVCGGSE